LNGGEAAFGIQQILGAIGFDGESRLVGTDDAAAEQSREERQNERVSRHMPSSIPTQRDPSHGAA
jgi:hypothetical protein